MSNGSYVGLGRAICPVCGQTFETGEVLIHRGLKPVFPENGKTDPYKYQLCEEHQKLFEDGYIAMVGIDESQSNVSGNMVNKMEDAYRTGDIVHIREKVFCELFGEKNLKKNQDGTTCPMVFCDKETIEYLKKLVG